MRNVLLAMLVCLFAYTAGAQCQSGFTYTTSGLTATFTNTSTPTQSSLPPNYYTWSQITYGGQYYYFGSSAVHTFPAPGNYTVISVIQVFDSLTQTLVCLDGDTQTVSVNYNPCTVSMSMVQTGNTVVFTANNLSSTPGMTYSWDFGDGNTGSGSPVTHTYATAGYYHPILTATSSTANCTGTDSTMIQIAQNKITGLVIADSTSADTFKVWLIQYDSSSQTLYAVDSTVIWNSFTQIPLYTFNNVPAGTYRVKAAQLDGPTSGTGYVPTYHTSSLYWSTATTFYHSGGITSNKHIFMQQGMVTSGPGFIGGNVNMGANKGTAVGDPVAGMLIFLRDNAGNVIKHAYTDANGDYSFGNLPAGLYSIYPEEGGYTTTSTSVILTPNQTSANAVNFKKSDGKKTVEPRSTGINDMPAHNLFSIVPNPSNGLVTINWNAGTQGDADITVADITGRTVINTKAAAGAKTQLNLSELHAGMYFINIHVNGQTAVKKVMIEK